MEVVKVLSKEERLEFTSSTNDRWALFRCPVCSKLIAKTLSNGKRQETCGRSCKSSKPKTHGMCDTTIYKRWASMCQRVTGTTSNPEYWEGISCDPKWKTFEGFFQDMGMTYREGLSLDRIDNKKDYTKDNCQWITVEENRVKDKRKPVAQYTKDGVLLGEFISVHEAARIVYPTDDDVRQRAIANSICRAARKDRKTYKNQVWEYL